MIADHPHTDPGDGRAECDLCGKFVWAVTHSCKGVPVTEAAAERMAARYFLSVLESDPPPEFPTWAGVAP